MEKSKQARKQRKALYNAPTHVQAEDVSSHLSDELMKEYQHSRSLGSSRATP